MFRVNFCLRSGYHLLILHASLQNRYLSSKPNKPFEIVISDVFLTDVFEIHCHNQISSTAYSMHSFSSFKRNTVYQGNKPTTSNINGVGQNLRADITASTESVSFPDYFDATEKCFRVWKFGL